MLYIRDQGASGRHSPGDSVAVHSLAVSEENTLEGRRQRSAQGCMETVSGGKEEMDREGDDA